MLPFWPLRQISREFITAKQSNCISQIAKQSAAEKWQAVCISRNNACDVMRIGSVKKREVGDKEKDD